MTTPTLIVTPPSPPAPSYSANRVPQPSLMDKIKKIAAIASLILIGTIGFLALLGHLVGFLIAPQIHYCSSCPIHYLISRECSLSTENR